MISVAGSPVPGRLLKRGQRGAEGGQVVHVVDLQHVPAVAGEPLSDIFAEGQVVWPSMVIVLSS